MSRLETPEYLAVLQLEDFFESYRESCIHPEAEKFQVDELRQSFYAGMGTMFQLLNRIADVKSEEDAAPLMSRIDSQIAAYVFSRADIKRQ